MKPSILWMSDSPTSYTGYGIVTKNIIERLSKLDYNLSAIGWQHSDKKTFGNIQIYPGGKGLYGKDVLQTYLDSLKPDLLITLGDLFFFNYFKDINLNNTKWVPYYPIDGDSMPEQFKPLLALAYKRITMSNYAANLTKEIGMGSETIYHGVDTNVFKPLNKQKIKEKYSPNDNFIIGCVARNQPRKMLPRLLKIFKAFSQDKKDVILYLHTTPYYPKGHNLPALISKLGLQGRVKFSKKDSLFTGFTFNKMNEIYNLFDVHASTTSGEGFGLFVLESMACGVPNIATDCTSLTELIKGRGELVKVQTTITDQANTERALVDIKDFVDKLQYLYDNEDVRKDYSRKSIEFARQNTWDKLINKWDDLLRNET